MKDNIEPFDQTSGAIARAAGVLPATVTRYALLGLIEHRVLTDGTRVYRASAAAQVRTLKAKRMAAPRRPKEVAA